MRLRLGIAILAALMPVCAPTDIRTAASEPCFFVVSEREARAEVGIDALGRSFRYRDELVVPSDFTVKECIEKRRINDCLDKKLELVDSYLQNGADHKTALLVCFPRLKDTVDEISAYIYRAPVNAAVTYNNGSYGVNKDKCGRKLDENRLYCGIYYSLRFFGGERPVKAAAEEVRPDVTEEELKSELILRAEYTTDFSSSSSGRAHNVAFAAKKLGGVSIAPGETLSFNGVVGERTEENGFKTAKIIQDGKYVDGVGGGVCQASTAVYNAALMAGLKVSCNAHSICPSYCPPGLDAMISSVSDLTITNTTGRNVYFAVKAAGGKVTVRVYGEASEYTIMPESVTDRVIPYATVEETDTEHRYFCGAPSGTRRLVSPGKDGYESSTYINYYKAGELVKRVKVRENTYKPVPQIIAVAP